MKKNKAFKRSIAAIGSFDFIRLTDDEEELLDLLSVAHSLQAKAEAEMRLRRRETNLIQNKLKVVRNAKPDLQITDHAIVRYLQRVLGYDVEGIRKEMLTKVPSDYLKSVEPGFLKIDVDGFQYVIRDNIIISVVPVGEGYTHDKTIDA